MTSTFRGADIVMRTLERAGHTDIFTLSGNHIMSLFDAAIDTKLSLMHVRHEAATVHMADAYGRLTGRQALPGSPEVPATPTRSARCSPRWGRKRPMVLFSGHTETDQLGRGGFQELRQVEMAAPVCKAAWMATDTATVGMDVAKAMRLATSGRPGPVHLSLPSDVLDATVPEDAVVWPSETDFVAPPMPLADAAARCGARRCWRQRNGPLVIGAPVLANRSGRDLLRGSRRRWRSRPASARDRAASTMPAWAPTPRSRSAPTWSLLLGKAFDFTLKFGGAPFAPDCRFIAIDPDGAILGRAARSRGLAFGCVADTCPAAETLIARARRARRCSVAGGGALLLRRPAGGVGRSGLEDPGEAASGPGVPDAAAVPGRDPDSILICDGGEFAQWGQSMLRNDRRMINGVAGSIGSSLPMAVGRAGGREDGAGVRGARRRDVRVPHVGDRNGGAAGPALRRDRRHRLPMERGV